MKSLSRRSNSEDCSGNEGFRVSLNQMTRNIFTVYLFGLIEDPSQFIDTLEALGSAGPDDVVLLKINSPGGCLDSTDTLVSAMRACPAHIVAQVSGIAHSAASIIMLNADELDISDTASCLLHNGSVGQAGKFSDWSKQAKHTEAYMRRVMQEAYEGFLTDEELEGLLEGKDIWMSGEQIRERWEARDEYFQALIDEAISDASEDSCPDCGNEECSCESYEAVGATD